MMYNDKAMQRLVEQQIFTNFAGRRPLTMYGTGQAGKQCKKCECLQAPFEACAYVSESCYHSQEMQHV